jgi:hypothetical protein
MSELVEFKLVLEDSSGGRITLTQNEIKNFDLIMRTKLREGFDDNFVWGGNAGLAPPSIYEMCLTFEYKPVTIVYPLEST